MVSFVLNYKSVLVQNELYSNYSGLNICIKVLEGVVTNVYDNEIRPKVLLNLTFMMNFFTSCFMSLSGRLLVLT